MCIYYRDDVTKGANSYHDKLQRPQSLAICSESVSSIDSCYSNQTKAIEAQIGVSKKADDSETRNCNGVKYDEPYVIENKDYHHHVLSAKATNIATEENIWNLTKHITCRASLNECNLHTKIYKEPPNMRCNGVGHYKKFRIGNVREILLSIVYSIL